MVGFGDLGTGALYYPQILVQPGHTAPTIRLGYVVSDENAAVRAEADTESEFRCALPKNTVVHIKETRGRRARISCPMYNLHGWVSLTSAEGAEIVRLHQAGTPLPAAVAEHSNGAAGAQRAAKELMAQQQQVFQQQFLAQMALRQQLQSQLGVGYSPLLLTPPVALPGAVAPVAARPVDPALTAAPVQGAEVVPREDDAVTKDVDGLLSVSPSSMDTQQCAERFRAVVPKCGPLNLGRLLKHVEEKLPALSSAKHGHVIVSLLVHHGAESHQAQAVLVRALRSYVVALMKDTWGSRVVTKIMETFRPQSHKFISNALRGSVVSVATQAGGVGVVSLLRVLEHSTDDERADITREIAENSRALLDDGSGCALVYSQVGSSAPTTAAVVKAILAVDADGGAAAGESKWSAPSDQRPYLTSLLKSVPTASVVSKCVQSAGPAEKASLVAAVMETDLRGVLTFQCGSWAVLTVVDECPEHLVPALERRLALHLPFSTIPKQLDDKLAARCSAVAAQPNGGSVKLALNTVVGGASPFSDVVQAGRPPLSGKPSENQAAAEALWIIGDPRYVEEREAVSEETVWLQEVVMATEHYPEELHTELWKRLVELAWDGVDLSEDQCAHLAGLGPDVTAHLLSQCTTAIEFLQLLHQRKHKRGAPGSGLNVSARAFVPTSEPKQEQRQGLDVRATPWQPKAGET
eukprot:TRINITY_DN251_c2_g1_i2.p1 TRINITY_DN251_c2_g1~~TRINITY_DN251_c2_g1_i2.p1  ORF type:complete len:694 (+),score=199.11 TRINITY_DN251_c2_g1_i2:113-2194(+)